MAKVAGLCVALLLVSLASGCSFLPAAGNPPQQLSLAPAASGPLARLHRAAFATPPDPSGYRDALLPVHSNRDALRWRLALVDSAVSAIDAQYFIWEDDIAGVLLFQRILQAADRGVRVRLLVDDFTLATNDRVLAGYTTHPNIHIKLFNPGKIRNNLPGALAEIALLSKEINRRMHNKLLIVDGRVAIIGGRNIGAPYFGLSERYNFRDFDTLLLGPSLQTIARAFDNYWNTPLSFPASALDRTVNRDDLQRQRQELAKFTQQQEASLVAYPLAETNWEPLLAALPEKLLRGQVYFIQDQASKIGEESYRLWDMLRYMATPTREELLVITPYLIPSQSFLEELQALGRHKVTTKILTNSLGSNNHTITHSHYKKYRRRILESGAQLYEAKHQPDPSQLQLSNVTPVTAQFTTLHIKALVADKQRCFIGSLNLDPRALEINTENGLYIVSAEYCGELAEQLGLLLRPENAWQVSVDEGGQLRWRSSTGELHRQPARSTWQRISDFFLRLLPLEKQL